MSTGVRILGLEVLKQDLLKVSNRLEEMCRQAVFKGTRAGVAHVKAAPTFSARTGRLQKSGKARLVKSTRTRSSGYMRWDTPYALIVDKGSKPHEIRPRLSDIGPRRQNQRRRPKNDIGTYRTKLRWVGAGGYVFARVVHHPGTQGYEFGDSAIQPCVDAAFVAIRAGIAECLSIMSNK